MAAETLTTEDLDKLRTYTLEEIDSQLSALRSLHQKATRNQKRKIETQINLWLERRFELTNGG